MGRIFKTLIVGFALKTSMLHPDFPRHKKKNSYPADYFLESCYFFMHYFIRTVQAMLKSNMKLLEDHDENRKYGS